MLLKYNIFIIEFKAYNSILIFLLVQTFCWLLPGTLVVRKFETIHSASHLFMINATDCMEL
jgi:hypothetical protein